MTSPKVIFVAPDPRVVAPPIVPVTCTRLATNQFGDPDYLEEPLPGAPGNTGPGSHIWYSDGSSATGIHQQFLYEEELQGAALIVGGGSFATSSLAVLNSGAIPEALPGDTLVVMVGATDATILAPGLWNGSEQFTPTAIANGSLSVGVASHVVVGNKGTREVIVILSAVPTQAFMKVFVVRGAGAAEAHVTDSGTGTVAAVVLTPDADYNINLACLGTESLASPTHTVTSEGVIQNSYDDLNDLQFSTMKIHNPTAGSQPFSVTLGESSPWAEAGVSLPAAAGSVIAGYRQFIIMRDVQGTFQDGELLTALEL